MRERFDRWIFDAYEMPAASLGICRILFAAFALLYLSPGHGKRADFDFIPTYPDAFYYAPFGPMRAFDAFPGPLFFDVLLVLIYLSLVALLIGYRTRWASLVSGGLLFVGFGFLFSFGKINHIMPLLLVPIIMAASNWGARYSCDALRRAAGGEEPLPQCGTGWPVALLALCLAFGMGLAGLHKALGGWLDPGTQAVQGYVVQQLFNGRTDFLVPWAANIDSVAFWELQDYATVILEVGFLVAVAWPLVFRLFAAGAVFLHLGVALTMNILFVTQLPVYALFVDWTRLPATLPEGVHEASARFLKQSWAPPLVVVGGGLAFWWWGSPLQLVDQWVTFEAGSSFSEVLLIALAAAALMVAAGCEARRRYVRLREGEAA